MLPMRHDPFLGGSPFTSLQREINRLFGDVVGETEASMSPRLDFTETKDGYRIEADLPGVDADDLEVEVTGDMLVIRGEKSEERSEDEEGTTRIRERRFQRYERAIALPESIDPSKVRASLRNGVLVLTMPRSEEARPRRIEVTVEGRQGQVEGTSRAAGMTEGKATEGKTTEGKSAQARPDEKRRAA